MGLARLLAHLIEHALEIRKALEPARGRLPAKILGPGSGTIIGLTTFRVSQHTVSFVYFLEKSSIASTIRVMFHGQFTEGLANLVIGGGPGHTKYLVVILHSIL